MLFVRDEVAEPDTLWKHLQTSYYAIVDMNDDLSEDTKEFLQCLVEIEKPDSIIILNILSLNVHGKSVSELNKSL